MNIYHLHPLGSFSTKEMQANGSQRERVNLLHFWQPKCLSIPLRFHLFIFSLSLSVSVSFCSFSFLSLVLSCVYIFQIQALICFSFRILFLDIIMIFHNIIGQRSKQIVSEPVDVGMQASSRSAPERTNLYLSAKSCNKAFIVIKAYYAMPNRLNRLDLDHRWCGASSTAPELVD